MRTTWVALLTALLLLTTASQCQEDMLDALPHVQAASSQAGSSAAGTETTSTASASAAGASGTAGLEGQGFLDRLFAPYYRLMGTVDAVQETVQKPVSDATDKLNAAQEYVGREVGGPSDEDWKEDL